MPQILECPGIIYTAQRQIGQDAPVSHLPRRTWPGFATPNLVKFSTNLVELRFVTRLLSTNHIPEQIHVRMPLNSKGVMMV